VTDDTATAPFRALDALLKTYPPLRYRRAPFWHSPAPRAVSNVLIPAWNWSRNLGPAAEQLERFVLDCNGAFMSPLSGTELAHGPLVHTGAWGESKVRPGYYQIDAQPWSDPRIVSPLGGRELKKGALVWVAHPTVQLLADLTDAGYWPGVTVFDSYTPRLDSRDKPEICRLSDWADYVKGERAAALTSGDSARYQAVKDGYSVAIQMMLGKNEDEQDQAKAKIKRPDWYHALRATHSANMWRKAWRTILAGYPIVGMGHVDEITLAADDYDALRHRDDSPLKFDPSGLQLGAFKLKAIIKPEDGR
jgi:hypothetical protein